MEKNSWEVLSKAMEKILMGEDEIMEGDGESTLEEDEIISTQKGEGECTHRRR